jgi:hypothetical protein
MKTLLGFAALLLYTFTMLAWGRLDTAQLCCGTAPSSHAEVSACTGQAEAGK